MSRRKLSSFAKFRRKYGLSIKAAAVQFEVTPQTIRNWQYREPPRWVLRMIERQDRYLSGIHPAWAGWRIGWNGKLYGPHGFQIGEPHLRQAAFSAWMEGYLDRRKTPAEPVAPDRDGGEQAPQS